MCLIKIKLLLFAFESYFKKFGNRLLVSSISNLIEVRIISKRKNIRQTNLAQTYVPARPWESETRWKPRPNHLNEIDSLKLHRHILRSIKQLWCERRAFYMVILVLLSSLLNIYCETSPVLKGFTGFLLLLHDIHIKISISFQT